MHDGYFGGGITYLVKKKCHTVLTYYAYTICIGKYCLSDTMNVIHVYDYVILDLNLMH